MQDHGEGSFLEAMREHYGKLSSEGKQQIEILKLCNCSWLVLPLITEICSLSKEKSNKAKLARSCVQYNHTSGSKSFLSRASIFVKNNGREQPITEKFKGTHIRHLDGKEVWINDKAQQHHDEMVSKIVEQSQPDVSEPLSEDQLAMQVLGKRSAYLKGTRNHKSISSSFIEAKEPDPEVIALRKQVDTFQSILQVLAVKAGVDLASIPGLVPNSEGEDDTFCGGHDTTFLE